MAFVSIPRILYLDGKKADQVTAPDWIYLGQRWCVQREGFNRVYTIMLITEDAIHMVSDRKLRERDFETRHHETKYALIE